MQIHKRDSASHRRPVMEDPVELNEAGSVCGIRWRDVQS